MSEKIKTTITLFGEEREFEVWNHGGSLSTVGAAVVGRFPTGQKLHASSLTLWKREQAKQTLRGATAAVVDGVEYVADLTLYLHNSNRGRIVAWNDDLANSGWTGAAS